MEMEFRKEEGMGNDEEVKDVVMVAVKVTKNVGTGRENPLDAGNVLLRVFR